MKLTQAQQIPTPQIQTLQIKVPQVMAMTQHGQTGHEQKIEQMEVLAQWTIDDQGIAVPSPTQGHEISCPTTTSQTSGQHQVQEDQQVTEGQQEMNRMQQKHIGQEQSAAEQKSKKMEVLTNHITILAQETNDSSYQGHEETPAENSPPTSQTSEEAPASCPSMDQPSTQVPRGINRMHQEQIGNEQHLEKQNSNKMDVLADRVTIVAQENVSSSSQGQEKTPAEYSPPTSLTSEESQAGYINIEYPLQRGKFHISMDQLDVKEMTVSSTQRFEMTPPNCPPMNNSSDDSTNENVVNNQPKTPNQKEDILKRALGLELNFLLDPNVTFDDITDGMEEGDSTDTENLFGVNLLEMLCKGL